ncbi:uncharacterized protein [Diabrotica undecimpunctata]|uniref:uncharacterized protein isoform X5 n=1 Tax=Diabrotica undecimpunctata TaxID=50387 RepID=UPI003B641040
MERKEHNEDTVKSIKFENSIFVNPEFLKKEPDPVYQDTYIKDYGLGDSDVSLGHIKTELTVEDMTFDLDQNQDDLGLQYSNSDVDNIKLEHTAKGSRSSEHDTFKNEIKEESNRESTHDTFDDSDLNEYSLKIEIKEDENKFMPYEEKQTKEKDFSRGKDTLESMKTIDLHSSNKEQHTSHTAEGKTLKCEFCVLLDNGDSNSETTMSKHSLSTLLLLQPGKAS